MDTQYTSTKNLRSSKYVEIEKVEENQIRKTKKIRDPHREIKLRPLSRVIA